MTSFVGDKVTGKINICGIVVLEFELVEEIADKITDSGTIDEEESEE